jgi:chemotaxis protein methyltransferase CheR
MIPGTQPSPSRFDPLDDKHKVDLTDAEFELFRKWLYSTAGIHLAPAKQALVAGRLNKRLRVLGASTYRQYFDMLSSTTHPAAVSERQIAVDLLTTNETFFFREIGHFDFLRATLIPQWGKRPVRCWSAASSSGEEAYTLAMVLAAHHGGDWQIVGTDISSRVVETARQATYAIERSKNIPLNYLREYCLKGTGDKAHSFRIAPEIRQRVSFSLANLQQSQNQLGKFDLIFLRNVMIYFDLPSKQRVLHNVIDRLKPGGLLFVGHAESLNGVTEQVKLVKPSIYQYHGAS